MVKYMDNQNSNGFANWMARQQPQTKKSKFGGFLWWIILFVASWWLIGTWMTPTPQVPDQTPVAPVADLSNVPTSEIASDDITARVQGIRINDIKLHDFAANTSDETGPRVSLLGADGDYAEIGLIAAGTTAPNATTVWNVTPDGATWKNSDGVLFTRHVTADEYTITITDEIKNTTGGNISIAPYARIVRRGADATTAGVYTGAIAYANADVEHADWRQMDKRAYAYSTTTGFAGFADQYWETVASIDSPDQTIRIKGADKTYHADVAAAARQIAPGATDTITTYLYTGPRDQAALDIAAQKIVGINETVDYGWFWFLARPMAWILNALNAVVMNYGLAIIIFTLLLRLAMWPLTRKSYTSMIAMQKMQPEMARIQKLYANDKMRLQMEMMKLYQTHKTSPMSGCLPMLIQIPIFFALYKALLVSVQMRSASFLWISDLAAMDPYFILPILMGGTMWLQQRLQTASNKSSATGVAADVAAQTQRVMKWMPIVFTVLFAWMPAGLVLYWTVSNIFGIAQMYIIKHRGNK